MRDEIATGEALPDDGHAVVDITGMMALRLKSHSDPAARAALEEVENRAARLLRRAQAENVENPKSIKAAAAYVRAFNAYADIMGIERV